MCSQFTQPQAKIVQYLLRFNIGDVRSVFDKALVGVPRTPANDWLWDPSMVVSTVLDNSRHDNLTFSNVKAMVATLSAVLTTLADVDKFLSYFISLPQPSTVFRKYMDQQVWPCS